MREAREHVYSKQANIHIHTMYMYLCMYVYIYIYIYIYSRWSIQTHFRLLFRHAYDIPASISVNFVRQGRRAAPQRLQRQL